MASQKWTTSKPTTLHYIPSLPKTLEPPFLTWQRSEDWEFRRKLSCYRIPGHQIFLISLQVPIFLNSSMYLWKSSLWSSHFIVLIFWFRSVYFIEFMIVFRSSIVDVYWLWYYWNLRLNFPVDPVSGILTFCGILTHYFWIYIDLD